MITLLQRSNISPRCLQAASGEICVLLRCTIVRTLYYFTAESWELLYILSCPVSTTCKKRVFSTNFNNHNLIKTYELFNFCNVHIQCILQYTDIKINFWNSRSLYAIWIWNCAHAFTRACEWENLIVADVKLSKRNFDFYSHLLHRISIFKSKFRNTSTNILYSVLNSRFLKPIILKFSFMFIEFRYSLSIRVHYEIQYNKFTKSWDNDSHVHEKMSV